MIKIKEISKSWYFPVAIIILYIVIWKINPQNTFSALKYSADIFIKILPVFLLVFLLMVLANLFVKTEKLAGWLNKKQGWIIAIIGGIISSGPIYMWYPLLNDLQKKKVRTGLIAVFLYNRSVKIPLLPMMIIFFGIKFSIVLLIVTIFMSILQGIIVEKIVDRKKFINE